VLEDSGEDKGAGLGVVKRDDDDDDTGDTNWMPAVYSHNLRHNILCPKKVSPTFSTVT